MAAGPSVSHMFDHVADRHIVDNVHSETDNSAEAVNLSEMNGDLTVRAKEQEFRQEHDGLETLRSETEHSLNVIQETRDSNSHQTCAEDPEIGNISETRFASNHSDEVNVPSMEQAVPQVTISHVNLQQEEMVPLRAHLTSMWYLAVVILTPIVCLPIILIVDDQFQKPARCGYTIAVMAIYWTTECIPIAVTALLPIVMLPMMGVLSARVTSGVYFNDSSMMLMGGLLVAIAIELWNVHKRIALLVLKIVGAEPRCLLLGITLVTWFLSIWISNTATAAMMMTIVSALLEQFENINDTSFVPDKVSSYDTNLRQVTEKTDKKTARVNDTKRKAELLRLGKALSLTVAYAANIGGIASLTGTGPNLVLFAAAQRVYEDVGLRSPITFSTWFLYGLPLSLLLVGIMWLWMVLIFLRCRGGCVCCCSTPKSKNEQLQKVNEMIHDEYRKLGPVTYAQWTVFVLFVVLIFTWITRDLGGIGGWKAWFPGEYVSDSTPSLLFGILMFVLPSSSPMHVFRKCSRSALYRKVTPLLSWKNIHEKMPWSLYLLLGGGYALARAATDSGLSAWIGDQLLVFRHLNHWLILLIVCYIITFATEVTSNTAIATLMMPILSQMAIGLQVNPLLLMFPGALTTSFAFMLPVATPPNAIVFSYGMVRIIDMVISGLFLNCISVPILLFATATWGNAFFHFEQLPLEFLVNTTRA